MKKFKTISYFRKLNTIKFNTDNRLEKWPGIGCLKETKRHRAHYRLPIETTEQQQTLQGN